MNKYYMKPEGFHYYRLNEDGSVLHVCNPKKDATVYTEHERCTTVMEFKAGDALINKLDEVPMMEKLIKITQETFDTNLKEAILALDIWSVCVPK